MSEIITMLRISSENAKPAVGFTAGLEVYKYIIR